MSIPSKQSSPDRKQDKSDVLSLLTVIKRLFETSQEVLNTHAQTALMLSITLEAQMLLMKLRVMKDRWQYHLPFKEACRVRFDDWSKRMERMAESLFPTEEEDGENEQVSEYCPSKHFLLDLYETLPENASSPEHVPYYKELASSSPIRIVSASRLPRTGWHPMNNVFPMQSQTKLKSVFLPNWTCFRNMTRTSFRPVTTLCWNCQWSCPNSTC